MRSYLYDGTLPGLLTALATAVARPEEADLLPPGRSPGLFAPTEQVITDCRRAAGFLRYLAEYLPRELWEEIFYSLFADLPEAGTTILAYLRLLLTRGPNAARDWTDPRVRQARRLAAQVRQEVHRLHGFLRFKLLANGIYYAAITPVHAVLPLLAPHFAARFADQRWFIHDTIRNSGLYYDGRRVHYLPKVDPLSPATRPDPVEAAFEELFREYFRRIAIPERKNEPLQRQRIPRRYRRYMLELEETPSDRGHQPGKFGKIF
ncbi:MAG: TIGR03915 family putative DNA repair protein [Bacillota bacterium]